MVTQKRTVEFIMLLKATNALARGDSISTNALHSKSVISASKLLFNNEIIYITSIFVQISWNRI